MKVLVTGGAGFIGSHIVDAMLAAGHDVAVIDNLSSGYRANVDDRARLYEVDIRDADAVDAVFVQEEPEVISHQAAKANVRESMVEPVLYAQVNILGSLNLLEAARRHHTKKLIYASTGGAVYGELEYVPADENHPIKPLDPYGASKHQVEHYLYIYSRHYGLDYTVLRYPNVYGPRQDPNGEAGVIAIWAARMLNNRSTIIYGTGEQQRDFVFVTDIARANVLAVNHGNGEIINLGSTIGTSINQVYDLLSEITGYTQERVYGPAKQGEVFCSYITHEKAERLLGWQPTVALKQGLERTVAACRR
ncbi:MAG: NAD-dependent epimerase/dehydratase family protein [Anaerolineae bacterium]|jgi:UDP-glucose 4-epimerase|nr:NAD-dependent epimerase/dehydratase family protein [Chloroflexota bacterium]